MPKNVARTPRLLLALAVALISGNVVTTSGSLADGSGKPLQVFILAGQSNMQGHAHVRTLDAMAMDPETVSLLKEIRADDGTPRVCGDVWISSLSSAGVKHGRLSTGYGADGDKMGPELTFGITMRKRLGEPILIIKTAWGGKSLHTDFRPPSAGPYEFSEAQRESFMRQGKDFAKIQADKVEATGRYFRLMTGHVKQVLEDIEKAHPAYDRARGFELAGFVWFQGWNDMVDRGTYPGRGKPGGYDLYSRLLGHLIRDVRSELSAPRLPFVIGVMGVGGPTDRYLPDQQRYKAIHQNFRDAMAAPAKDPEFEGRVAAVLTERYWDVELAALRARDARIRQLVRKLRSEENLDRGEEQAELEKRRAEAFTPRERELLEKGVSNQEYHYLGSARIMALIGRGFAETLHETMAETAGNR